MSLWTTVVQRLFRKATPAAPVRAAPMTTIVREALAAAGLLDGRPATTHWTLADEFRRLFPQVALNPDVLFVDDANVLTSAGRGEYVRIASDP